AREFVACLNAGDVARLTALFTDGAVRRTVSDVGTPSAAFDAALKATPHPLAEHERAAYVGLVGGIVDADGSIFTIMTVAVPAGAGYERVDYAATFRWERGRYRIDGLAQFDRN